MAITTTLERKNASGSQSTTYSYSFPLYQSTDLSVKVLDAGTWATKILDTHYTHDSTAKTIQFKEGQVPTSGDNTILLERVTDLDAPKADYTPGTAIKAADLDNNSKQERYASEELHSRAADLLNPTFYGNVTFASTQTFDGRDASVDGAKLDLIEPSATADQTAAEIRTLVESASDSNVFTDEDHSKLNAIEASADVTDATNVDAAGAVMNSDSSTAAMSFVVDEDNFASDSATKVPTQQSVKAYIGTTSYTKAESDANYYNIGTTEEIVSGETWTSDDAKVATTKAIDNRVVDLIDDVGGFVALTNEAAIPAAHPEAANATTSDRVGTILSIGVLSSTYTPSGGTCTIPHGTLTNHSVNATITDCGSTTLSAGFGVLVETTAQTDAQYAAGPAFKFHRLTPKATEVTTVAGKATEITTCHTKATEITTVAGISTEVTNVAGKSTEIGRLGTTDAVADMALLGTADCVADMAILGTSDVVADLNTLATSDIVSDLDTVATNITDVSNFADLYQIATSAPGTDGGGNSLAAGDLWFDSSSNKVLKVYDGSAFASTSPSQSVLNDIANVSGQLTYKEDLGSIADALTTETGNNINTVANNINTINSFSDQYRVAASAPSTSLTEGDLWYDSTGNTLKYYNGSAWVVTAAAGLSEIVGDTSPELGGHLDCNDKNLTEVGTVSGDNLQIDFGAIA